MGLFVQSGRVLREREETRKRDRQTDSARATSRGRKAVQESIVACGPCRFCCCCSCFRRRSCRRWLSLLQRCDSSCCLMLCCTIRRTTGSSSLPGTVNPRVSLTWCCCSSRKVERVVTARLILFTRKDVLTEPPWYYRESALFHFPLHRQLQQQHPRRRQTQGHNSPQPRPGIPASPSTPASAAPSRRRCTPPETPGPPRRSPPPPSVKHINARTHTNGGGRGGVLTTVHILPPLAIAVVRSVSHACTSETRACLLGCRRHPGEGRTSVSNT